MQLIIISDIFGKTSELISFADNFEKLYQTIRIVDPYDGEIKNFKNEGEAYNSFQKNCGLALFSNKVLDAISMAEGRLDLIGFSVGASAIWKISENHLSNIKNVFCFYGSKIREMVDINPSFFINLIFPNSEKHFSVEALFLKICKKENVYCEKTIYNHGFMNQRSLNYDEAGYKMFTDLIKQSVT